MDPNPSDIQKPPRGRLIVGAIVFIAGFMSPALIPFVLATDLSAGLKTTLTGLLALGIPELFMLIAAAILGKPGFIFLKQKLAAWFKKYGPPQKVSRTRYRIGLVMFLVPLIIGWVLPYAGKLIPFYESCKLWFFITGDILFVSSLFVLGGDFWDKLRALFTYQK
jgi:hypothetical protein